MLAIMKKKKKRQPQILTAAESLVFFDVRVVPRDLNVYSSVTLRPRGDGKLRQQGSRLTAGETINTSQEHLGEDKPPNHDDGPWM